MRIYDIRVRPPFKGFLKCRMYADRDRTRSNTSARGQKVPLALESLDVADTLKEMAEAGITHGLVSARVEGNPIFDGVSNEDVLELVDAHPKQFSAAVAVDPLGGQKAADAIERLSKNASVVAGVVEPGILKDPAYLDDRRIDPIWEACGALNLPVLAMGGGVAGPDVGYADPVLLDRVAARFPKVNIVAVHGGWPYVTQILGVAFRRPNIYVSPDLYLPNMPGWRDYVDAANSYLQDRFLTATAYPFAAFGTYMEQVRAMPFQKDILPKILFDNAARLFRHSS